MKAAYAANNRARGEGGRNLLRGARGGRRALRHPEQRVLLPPDRAARPAATRTRRCGPTRRGCSARRCAVVEQAEREALAAGGVVLRYGFFGGPGTWYDADGAVGAARPQAPLSAPRRGRRRALLRPRRRRRRRHRRRARRPLRHLQRRRRPPRPDRGVAARLRGRAGRAAAAADARAAGRSSLGGRPLVDWQESLEGASNARAKAALDWTPVHATLADRVPRPVRFRHGAHGAKDEGERVSAVLDVLRPRDQALHLHRLELPRALPVRRSAERAPLHGLPAQGLRDGDRRRAVRRGREDPGGLRRRQARRRSRASAARSRSSGRSPTASECVNRRFFDWPEAAPGAVRAFDLRDRL